MKRLWWCVLLLLLVPAGAHAATKPTVDEIDESVGKEMADGPYTFCKSPRKPLDLRARDLCALSDIEGCEGFDAACKNVAYEEPAAKKSSSPNLAWLADLARVLLFVLVAAIVVAIAIPIIAAFRRARRNKKLADRPAEAVKATAVPVAPPPVDLDTVGDAEAALRMAEEHRRRGEYTRALALYLAAALTALDRRGAIRIAKHRTNGEYVRFCTDDGAKPPLREIVREVDKVQYGKIDPTEDAVARVAARAASVVRQAATMTLVALSLLVFASGCGGGKGRGYDDPAGDELPIAVLKRHGFDVAPLGRSIASMPVAKDKDDTTPKKDDADVVVIDVDRVAIDDDETEAHLMRWVEEGGVLVLFGSPSAWPKELGAKTASAASREVTFQDYRDDWKRSAVIEGRVARPRAVSWSDATAIGWLDKDEYIVRKLVGRGVVFGIANDDLFTNVGILPKHNAAILVSVMHLAGRDARMIHPERGEEAEEDPSSSYGSGGAKNGSSEGDDTGEKGTASGGKKHEVKVRHAQREDGIPPPSTPFAALLAAGLGKGTWHALAAALILFVAVGVRHSKPRGKEAQARRAFTEHVEATGAFWGRAKALPHALAAYGKFVELRLRERVPRGHDPVAFLAARANVDPDHAARLYKRAIDAKDDDPVRGDELETIRELRIMLTKALEAS